MNTRTSAFALFTATMIIGALSYYAFGLKTGLNSDTIGYIQDATNLLHGQGLVRVPYGIDPDPIDVDAAPTQSFPPGFPVMVAMLSTSGLSPFDSAVWLTRVAWMLVPLGIFLAIRPAVGDGFALIIGSLAACSPSFYLSGASILTDALAVLLMALSAGQLFRAVGGSLRPYQLVAGGIFAGLAYVTRNASTAFLCAVAAAFVAAPQLRILTVRSSLRCLAWFSVGALAIMLPMFVRNLNTFGTLQPYALFLGTQTSLMYSFRVLLEALFWDLTGSRSFAIQLAWDYRLLIVLGIPALIAVGSGLWSAWRRGERLVRFFIIFSLFYVVAGTSMVVIAHTYSGVDPGYLIRHVMPYSWVVLSLVALAVFGGRRDAKGPLAPVAIWIGFALLLAGRIYFIASDLTKEAMMAAAFEQAPSMAEAADAFGAKRWIMTNQINRVLVKDPQVRESLADLPERAFVVSNNGSFVTFVTGRPARNLEVGNTAEIFTQLDAAARRVAGVRPVYAAIIPDNRMFSEPMARDWKRRLIEKMPPGYAILHDFTNILVLAVPNPAGVKVRRPVD